jgi:hypothetical protein
MRCCITATRTTNEVSQYICGADVQQQTEKKPFETFVNESSGLSVMASPLCVHVILFMQRVHKKLQKCEGYYNPVRE